LRHVFGIFSNAQAIVDKGQNLVPAPVPVLIDSL